MDHLNTSSKLWHSHLSPASRHAIGAWLFWYMAANYADMPQDLIDKWRLLPYR